MRKEHLIKQDFEEAYELCRLDLLFKKFQRQSKVDHSNFQQGATKIAKPSLTEQVKEKMCWWNLSIGQLNSSRTLVSLLDVNNVILAGAVLGVLGLGPIQGVLVTGQHRVEVRR